MPIKFFKLKFRTGRFSANVGAYLKRRRCDGDARRHIPEDSNIPSSELHIAIPGRCASPVMPNSSCGTFLQFDE
jgi:hypothetical protein